MRTRQKQHTVGGPRPGRRFGAGAGGFTLLELLVVIVVLVILVAISLPSLRAARLQANRAACGALLHGLGNAMQTYLQVNEYIMPASAMLPSVNAPIEPLPVTLEREVTAPSSWRCPGDNLGYVRQSDGKAFASYYAGETLSYEYNMSLGGRKVERWFLYGLLGDHGTYVLSDFDAFHGPKGAVNAKNILFADGHVGTVAEISQALGLPTSPTTSPSTGP